LFSKIYSLNKTRHDNVLSIAYYFSIISIPVTVIFYFFKVKPDNITYSRFFIGILASIFLYLNQSLVALFLYLAFIILDYSDGALARLYKNKTFYGKFLDGNVDHLCATIFYVIIGFYFYKLSKNIIDLVYSMICVIVYFRGQTIYDLYSTLVRWSNLECNKKNEAYIRKKNFILLQFLNANDFLRYIFLIIILINDKRWGFLEFYIFFFGLLIFGFVTTTIHFLGAYKNLKFRKT